MRALLAVILLAPTALAQPDVVDWIQAEIAPLAPIVPLQAAQTTTMTTRVSCLLSDVAGIPLTYTLVEAPAWASITISPASDVVPVGECPDGHTAPRDAQLVVSASDRAPAFTPTPLIIQITAGAGERQRTERATLNVSAAYFSILDVQAPVSQVVIQPGASHDFRVGVMNLANARTRVAPVVIDQSDGITVTLPPPLVLGSRHQGASDFAGELIFRVTSSERGGFVNAVELLNVKVEASYAEDAAYAGDSTAVSFLVTVRSGVPAAAERSPVPPPALPLVLIGLALVAASARRRV